MILLQASSSWFYPKYRSYSRRRRAVPDSNETGPNPEPDDDDGRFVEIFLTKVIEILLGFSFDIRRHIGLLKVPCQGRDMG